jgi:CheY-like chemotaxis protein
MSPRFGANETRPRLGLSPNRPQQLRYDLVVTDLEMPRMNGFELIGRLRGDPQHGATPVIIITSRTSPENRRRARELGVRSLVAKPVTRRKLLDALAPRAS